MTHKTDIAPSLRVPPAVWPGVLIYLVYMAVFYAVFILVDIDYGHISASAETLLAWLIPPTAAGFVVTVVLVSVGGWWSPALVEQRKLPRWAIFVPVLTAAVAIGNMILGNYSTVTPLMWLYLIGGCLVVGFNEEMVNRGALVVALRSRYGETMVWLLSTALFAVFHLPNIFFGIGALALVQVVIAFGMGSVFYLARRTTGSLLPAMLLHGLWDLSAFSAHVPYSGMLAPLLGVSAVTVVIIVLARERRAA
ncbi:type II CAAX endopeptidase family protein [Janthinobacterium sp.]|uniref:CPBP family intramembrane glutamic endopeptidase n=1 Tax=Janthinobacterium sp. TaxID=1871054 RepID=UPI002609DD19|nr:type II CAAX endopeptidase family protein [Janthinobacterium sp.]